MARYAYGFQRWLNRPVITMKRTALAQLMQAQNKGHITKRKLGPGVGIVASQVRINHQKLSTQTRTTVLGKFKVFWCFRQDKSSETVSVLLVFQASMVTFNFLKFNNWLDDINDASNKITFDVQVLQDWCSCGRTGYGNGSWWAQLIIESNETQAFFFLSSYCSGRHRCFHFCPCSGTSK